MSTCRTGSWIRGRNRCPATPEFVVTSTDHLLRAQVLAAVDGERSVAEIGELVARQYGLSTEEATAAVKRIFVEVCESRL